jgi:PAS domain S-box-containing protein
MTATLTSVVSSLLGVVFPPSEPLSKSSARPFEPSKDLCEKDEILIAMLNSQGHEHVAFCICDPDKADLPIIFSSEGFCEFTGYRHDEIEGRNCRFLQGKDTQAEDVDRIRKAVEQKDATSVNLLNYRKDGTSFVNEFFLSPRRSSDNKVVYVSKTTVLFSFLLLRLLLALANSLTFIVYWSSMFSSQEWSGADASKRRVRCALFLLSVLPRTLLFSHTCFCDVRWLYTQGNHA